MSKMLNENQRKAVNHNAGAVMVLAGPGSGKTTVILTRTKRLLQMPEYSGNILVLTYTKATATEMKERFSFYTGSRVNFSTFHGLFFKVLIKKYSYNINQIITESEKQDVFVKLMKGMDDINDYEEIAKKAQSQISFMNNELIKVEDFSPQEIDRPLFLHLYHGYQEYKKSEMKIDFDDMLIMCYELFLTDEETLNYWRNMYPCIMVDEFQDINRVQYECLRMLAYPNNNVMVVGDDDQSIYGFRGARPDYLIEFKKHFPDSEQVILNENYRFHNGILNIANKVIRQNSVRHEKHLKSLVDVEENHAVKLIKTKNTSEEAIKICEKIQDCINNGVPYNEIAIIYRINIQGGVFVRELSKRGIPYIMRDGGNNIYNHWVAKDLMAYLKLVEDIDDSQSFLRIINKPKRFISKAFLSEAEETGQPIFRGCFACESIKNWQEEKLYELQSSIAHMKSMSVYKALKYVRKVIGYDEYLAEYASYRHINLENLMEIADEIVDMSQEAESIQVFREQLESLAVEMKTSSLNNKKSGEGENENKVSLLTMHSAKGLEFTAVFLPTLIDTIMPHKRNPNIEEERRLFYVGITRAKQILYLSTVEEYHGDDTKISPFVKTLSKKA